MEVKNRKEMDPQFQWEYSHIFESKDAWEQEIEHARGLIPSIQNVAGTLGDSAESLKNGLDTIYGAYERFELVYLYAYLHKCGDNGDPEYQDMAARAMKLLVALETVASFAEPEILAIPEEILNKYIEDDGLKTYRHMLNNIARGRAHTLDAARERMLAMLGDAAQSPSDSFEMLESVDMTFPKVKDESGNEVELTHGNFNVYRESKNRRVREEAFEKYLGEFKKYLNTFTAMYSGSVKFDSYFADVRNFDNACQAALFGSNVPESVYEQLIEAIHSGLNTMRRYIDVREKVLGLPEIDTYDLYTPIVDDVDYKVTFEEAKVLVKEALKPLGEDYQRLLDKAYSEKWIDVYENKGKTTGAFSCGVYGVHPYVLLNYSDTLDDAYTLAHELGHAMHSYLSSNAQDYVNHNYRILVAEVASTVNEVLLTKHLLSVETDPKRRAYILNHFLEGFRLTVFRQTLFAEFEKRTHEMYKEGTSLTTQSLNKLYRELNELYYDGARVNDLMDVEWARIPHFYRAFYVYQYATGFCSAVSIAERILETGDASDYLKFLSLGGSKYPLDELKIAGVDLTKPEPVADALKVFDKTLDEFESIVLA